MYYSWWSAVSLRIQILPFFIDFTCGQIKGLFFFSFFLETFAPSGIRRNLSQKPPLTTFLISFIWTGSQADASVSPWLRGWGHFIGSHQTGFTSGAGSRVSGAFPRFTKSGERERGKWSVGWADQPAAPLKRSSGGSCLLLVYFLNVWSVPPPFWEIWHLLIHEHSLCLWTLGSHWKLEQISQTVASAGS